MPASTPPNATNVQRPSVLDKALVPSRLKALWAEAEAGRLTTEEFSAQERELIRGYAEIWADALLLPGEQDLKRSICVELGNLVGSDDLAEIERKCQSALHDMRDQWNAEVKKGDAKGTLTYYDKTAHYSYELMWWHSLVQDQAH